MATNPHIANMASTVFGRKTGGSEPTVTVCHWAAGRVLPGPLSSKHPVLVAEIKTRQDSNSRGHALKGVEGSYVSVAELQDGQRSVFLNSSPSASPSTQGFFPPQDLVTAGTNPFLLLF